MMQARASSQEAHAIEYETLVVNVCAKQDMRTRLAAKVMSSVMREWSAVLSRWPGVQESVEKMVSESEGVGAGVEE